MTICSEMASYTLTEGRLKPLLEIFSKILMYRIGTCHAIVFYCKVHYLCSESITNGCEEGYIEYDVFKENDR
jgi:hypothetical protein